MKKSVALAILLYVPFSASARAQSGLDASVCSVPVEVVISEATRIPELTTRAIACTPFRTLQPGLPREIPVFTQHADGSRTPGVRFCNTGT